MAKDCRCFGWACSDIAQVVCHGIFLGSKVDVMRVPFWCIIGNRKFSSCQFIFLWCRFSCSKIASHIFERKRDNIAVCSCRGMAIACVIMEGLRARNLGMSLTPTSFIHSCIGHSRLCWSCGMCTNIMTSPVK